EYFEESFPVKPRRISVEEMLKVKKETLVEFIRTAFGQEIIESKKPTIVVYGHGSYHHYTYGLCRVLATRRSEDFAYIHIDQHHDMWKLYGDSVDCSRFVQLIVEDCSLSHALLIGNKNEYKIPKRFISEIKNKLYSQVPVNELKKNLEKKLYNALKKLPDDVYISFDLDVMNKSEIQTGWPGGELIREEILQCIRVIKSKKNIIGVDILGWSVDFEENRERPEYQQSLQSEMAQKSLSLYAAIVSEIMGL
ncbi:unnamed protein product, partial [marine sediment metagenome]